MNNKYIYLLLCALVSLLAGGCSPMDDTYKDFIKDGPILYLTKIPHDSILIREGMYRVQIVIPEINDNRSNKVFVSWNNGESSTMQELNSVGKTEVNLDNLREGSFIFTCRLEDDDGHKSLNTDVQAVTYGEVYQSYLTNRFITSMQYDDDLHLNFSKLIDSTAIASSITWSRNGTEATKIFYYDQTNKIQLEKFQGTTFKMKTLYKPTKASLDIFPSKTEEIIVAVNGLK